MMIYTYNDPKNVLYYEKNKKAYTQLRVYVLNCVALKYTSKD